jgi:hypothetical protein
MADPFQEYRDLIWGTGPYAPDDSSGSAMPDSGLPQDQNTSFSDPSGLAPTNVGILGPVTPPAATNGPQDQSAVFLDPKALQSRPDLNSLAPPPPPGAAIFKTADDFPFYAPAATDFAQIYDAGQKIRDDNFFHKLFEVGPILHYGDYDLQRQDGSFNRNYTNASNFAVGDFMNGAGFSWPATVVLGDIYALTHDQGRIPPGDKPWWQAGYDAAAGGKLPKKGTP